MSVDQKGIAELVFATQNDSGRLWRFSKGTVTGNRLTFAPNYGRPDRVIDWSDANSGTIGSLAGDNRKNEGHGNNAVRSTRFTRLDG